MGYFILLQRVSKKIKRRRAEPNPMAERKAPPLKDNLMARDNKVDFCHIIQSLPFCTI
jgi:hypothetical protein